MSVYVDRESVIVRLRPHSRALFWPTMLLIVVVGAAAYLTGLADEQWQLITLFVVAALLVITGWFFPLCRWLSRRYTITTRRIVVRRGLFVRSKQEISAEPCPRRHAATRGPADCVPQRRRHPECGPSQPRGVAGCAERLAGAGGAARPYRGVAAGRGWVVTTTGSAASTTGRSGRARFGWNTQ